MKLDTLKLSGIFILVLSDQCQETAEEHDISRASYQYGPIRHA